MNDEQRVLIEHMLQVETIHLRVERHWRDLLAGERYQDPKRLARYGFKAYSQNDEDGILWEIFRRLAITRGRFLEFGVHNGLESCTAQLLLEGWAGTWFEADPQMAQAATRSFLPFVKAGRLRIGQILITRENIEDVLAQAGIDDLDLLVIDIDGNDYWVWEALQTVRPACVCIEYNATWRPPLSCVQQYDAGRLWDGTNYFGASLEALCRLGARKGYRIVGCSLAGVNAFFVREDRCGDLFLKPATAAEHYEPPRFYLRFLSAGHRSGMGPLEIIESL